MLTPVDNPSAYGLVETDAARQHPAVPREAERRRDHLQHHQRRHLRARARHVRPHSQGHAVVDRAQLLPVADRARRDVHRLRRSRLLDRHRHAGEVHAGAPRHHGRPLSAPRRSPTAPARAWVSPQARVEDGAIVEGPCFIDEGAVVKAGARIGPYSVVGRQCHIEEHAVVERAIIWPNTRDQPGSGRAAARSSAAIATSAATRLVDERRRARRQVGGHRLQPAVAGRAAA